MGIRQRLVGSYLVVIVTTVIILEAFLIAAVNYYYNYNIEQILTSQAELSASFYEQYFAGGNLEQQAEKLLKGFSHHSAAQVQIISSSGQLMQDSTGLQTENSMLEYRDVRLAASRGQPETWRGYDPIAEEEVLAVSYPLQDAGHSIGVVRFVTSLAGTKETVRQISVLLISIGLIVIGLVAVVGILLSRTITGSITGLKQTAEKMAEGDFTARAQKRYRDELGALADTLNTMAVKIQEQDQLKNEFISSVSHELRSPLTSIKGWVITLKSGLLTGKATIQDGLEIIESETDRLTRLVDELLDFSKFEDGRMVLNYTAFQSADFLQNIGKQLRPRAARQGITLQVQAGDSLPVIKADESRLKQVMINLLDNALKFTEPGGTIVITARLAGEQFIITVEDSGAGIAEQDVPKLFQKFYKGNHSMSGSGLGLSISEQIIKLHKGDISIDSRLGKGTKVTIFLPRSEEL